MKTAKECIATITEYLSVGGLFNPEIMEHDKVRGLLIDCREALANAHLAGELAGMERAAATDTPMPDKYQRPQPGQSFTMVEMFYAGVEAKMKSIFSVRDAKALATKEGK